MKMIERVALAIMEAPTRNGKFGDFIHHDEAMAAARAAIEAMRETSPEVERAGLEAIAKTGVGSPLYGWAAGDCFRAMLDAAVKD